MTPTDFCAIMDALPIQGPLEARCKALGAILGIPPYDTRTIYRWRSGERSVPPAVARIMEWLRDGVIVIE